MAAILIFLKFGDHFDFFKSFIYYKTTSNPLISTCVNKLMINYHSLRYFCEIFGHFGFYTPKDPPMHTSKVNMFCNLFI